MNKNICLIICFIIGVLVFMMIQGYCSCDIEEGYCCESGPPSCPSTPNATYIGNSTRFAGWPDAPEKNKPAAGTICTVWDPCFKVKTTDVCGKYYYSYTDSNGNTKTNLCGNPSGLPLGHDLFRLVRGIIDGSRSLDTESGCQNKDNTLCTGYTAGGKCNPS